MRYTLYCIIQPGELEIHALLLLCSLRKGLQGEYQLYACLPREIYKETELQPETVDILKDLEVSLIKVSNTYLKENKGRETGDLFSNKYFALPHLPGSDYTVFLDSDMLLMKKLDLSKHIHGADFLAKPVCYMNENRWDVLYALFGMEIPLHRVRSTVDHQEGPPYFNGGLFCIKSNLAEKLFTNWLDTFRVINESHIMDDNPVNREQAALAITIARMQISYYLLSEELNFPARSKHLTQKPYPYILHYHDPESIYKNSPALKVVKRLFEEYPALRDLSSRIDNWKILTASPLSAFHVWKRIKCRLKGMYQSITIR